MILFWNRREVWFGSDLDGFKNVRDVLRDNRIKFVYRIRTRGAAGAGVTRTYYVYIHKKDLEEAEFLLRSV